MRLSHSSKSNKYSFTKKEDIFIIKSFKFIKNTKIAALLFRSKKEIYKRINELKLKNKHDITGMKFNSYTVLKKIGQTKRQTNIWQVQCDCGVKRTATTQNLKRKTIKSCGCLTRREYVKSIENQAFGSQKIQAKNKNKSWQITKRQYLNIVKKPCVYCNEFSYRKNRSNENIKIPLNSLDRINNKPKYTISTVQSCCFICQKLKSTHTDKEFRDIIKKIYKHITLGKK